MIKLGQTYTHTSGERMRVKSIGEDQLMDNEGVYHITVCELIDKPLRYSVRQDKLVHQVAIVRSYNLK